MARYFALLGQRVEVQYRAGDIFLPATGRLVADSGKSIFLEEHFCQRGQMKNFRWEIPYQCIVRLNESAAAAPTAEPASLTNASGVASEADLAPLSTRSEKA